MEEYLLKAKNYQIFLSITFPAALAMVIPDFDPNVPLVKKVLIGLPYLFWVFMLGRALNLCVLPKYRLNETFLTINLFFLCIVFALVTMFLDYTVTFNGWAVLIPLYAVFCFLYLFYFAAKALTSAEQKRRTSFGEHFMEMLILLFGYLGIWYLQPRINAIWELNKDQFSDDEQPEEHNE